jgi:acyl-homoserine-lactone acylase
MKKIVRSIWWVWVPIFAFNLFAQGVESKRWERQAQRVSITRDDWGIAHVVGKTDADTVFGAIYAQAEDDFNRVETNYINAIGRLAEAEGEGAIWQDLRMKLFIDPADMKFRYDTSPAWLKDLMKAWADGLNYYLLTHPETKPRVITRFEPWMPLAFSEGSIGGDIESINLQHLQEFYGKEPEAVVHVEEKEPEPRGSNGMAISPKNTRNGNALLLINPHTSFFFRSELQMTSGEGLNAYGASTWGQFFIYQGFNQNCGWMHTSSAADAIDEFSETISRKQGRYLYKYGKEERPVITSTIRVPYKTANGMAERAFTVYRTHHGPVIRKIADDKWITVSLMQEPVKALMQSYGRTKARNYAEFKQIMDLHANSSNNTIYADRAGNTAYFHVNFIPRRDPRFDWTKPVDGSDPATDWKGLLKMEESPNLLNPAVGWLYNSNDWPWEAAGSSSRKQTEFPKYVDNGVQSPRGRHAVRVLEGKRDFTLDTLRDAAYDSYLTWFDKPLPALLRAWDESSDKGLKAKTAEQIAMLRQWDQRWSVDSVPTSLAVFWGEEIQKTVRIEAPRVSTAIPEGIASKANSKQMLEALVAASERLTTNFGSWRTPWGEINRFQRLTGDIRHPFTDAGASIPVGFTSAIWGSLASFGAAPYRGSKKIYGTSGNSFVAVVEFGKKVRARAVTAGGESGHPDSPHFNDQAERYATGNLREVYFYPDQLRGHTEKQYRPGSVKWK